MFPSSQRERKCSLFHSFANYIKPTYPNFEHDKVEFAKKITPYLSVTNSQDMLDLKEKIEQLYKQIEQWGEQASAIVLLPYWKKGLSSDVMKLRV